MEDHLKHGAFSWNELTTSDPKAAIEFYKKLFGWEIEVTHNVASPDGRAMEYDIAKVGDNMVGGIMAAPPGAPVAWTSYVTVDNVDETVKLAESLGAKVCLPPRDIPNVGRFAILADPQGAIIAVITYVKK
jgi:predicted enzyme related to lactoylglutathione lyase